MTQRLRLKKSTIVRLIVVLAAAFSSACGGVPQRAGMRARCPPTNMMLCEEFGPQSRCHCADAHVLERELERLGIAARSGVTGR